MDDLKIDELANAEASPIAKDVPKNDVELEKNVPKVEAGGNESSIVATHAGAIESAGNKTSSENADTVAKKSEEQNDEFLYLQRNEFTSEIYKIEVRNLGYFGIGEFKKLLKTKLHLDISKIKSPTSKDFAFVCFRSQEDQERAIATLNGYKWKGKELIAYAAKASADPLIKRRNEERRDRNEPSSAGNASHTKRRRTTADATCPLAELPYQEQLDQKTATIKDLLKWFINDLKRTNIDYRRQAENSAFNFRGVRPSPIIDGYRNKNEFTVGKNTNGEVVVGFRLGSYADGSIEVSEVELLPHLPDAAKWAAQSFQTFMRSASYFVPFNPETNSGHVRQLMVRTSTHTGEIMLVPGIYSSNLSSDELAQLKRELIAFYTTTAADKTAKFRCSSLYYQDVKHRTAGQMVSPVEHLWGTTHITDNIRGLIFRISPLAFFQINTLGADILYQEAIDMAAPEPHTTVLDICCGTGTIALAFAKHCKQVLGVEIVPEAISDAEHNAKANGITNCRFFAGNADDYIQTMVRQVVYDNAPGAPLDLVAVIDPPRAGLHNRSIAAIRAASAVNRLVYVACNPTRAQKNWMELGRPESKQYKGEPFFPISAVAVDMFPHTGHTEVIMLFERRVAKPTLMTDGDTTTSTTATAATIVATDNATDTPTDTATDTTTVATDNATDTTTVATDNATDTTTVATDNATDTTTVATDNATDIIILVTENFTVATGDATDTATATDTGDAASTPRAEVAP